MTQSDGNAPHEPFFSEIAGKTYDDPFGVPSLETLQTDMRRIVDFVETETGLASRWNGNVIISDETDANGDPKFVGRKEPECAITLHRVILGYKDRYLTSLHEVLHSVSIGMPMGERYGFWRSYEEGVVTALTELLAPKLAHVLGIELPTPINTYPRLTDYLEIFRGEAGLKEQDFYLTLLQMPVRARKSGIKEMVAEQRNQSTAQVEQDDELNEGMEIFRTLLY